MTAMSGVSGARGRPALLVKAIAADEARVAALAPSSDRAWIAQQQQLAAETRRYLAAGGPF